MRHLLWGLLSTDILLVHRTGLLLVAVLRNTRDP
jgi:hypothetical protein